MNVMRKLRGTASAPAGNGSTGSSSTTGTHNGANGGSSLPTAVSEDAMLDARVQMSLHTLKKLFNEYTHPKEPLSEQERDMKLYQMLSLFCKVSWLVRFSNGKFQSFHVNGKTFSNSIIFTTFSTMFPPINTGF